MWNVSSFEPLAAGAVMQVSNNEHATSHHLTRPNVKFADLIATCNIIKVTVNVTRLSTLVSFKRISLED